MRGHELMGRLAVPTLAQAFSKPVFLRRFEERKSIYLLEVSG